MLQDVRRQKVTHFAKMRHSSVRQSIQADHEEAQTFPDRYRKTNGICGIYLRTLQHFYMTGTCGRACICIGGSPPTELVSLLYYAHTTKDCITLGENAMKNNAVLVLACTRARDTCPPFMQVRKVPYEYMNNHLPF